MRYGVADVRAAIEEGWWATIVDGSRSVKYDVDKHYRRGQRLPVPRGTFTPKTGWSARPAVLLVPR